MQKRVALALDMGAAPMPDTGQVVVFDPSEPPQLPGLPPERVDVMSPHATVQTACAARGHRVDVSPTRTYAAALVCLSRARPFARLRLAEAASAVVPGGPVLVDGMKSDGVESALKDCRARVEIRDSFVKSHGRLFWFEAGPELDDLGDSARAWPEVEGFRTAPGVFSADGVDPGSRLLADLLPADLSGSGADLGAGWGFLASAVLTRSGVDALHLVEDDRRALDAARHNVIDPRARFHWADAVTWAAPQPLDFVVTNPPFHMSRAADPALGQAFIAAAAGLLSRQGSLWLVANRHLPYEPVLDRHFRTVTQVVARSGYKVIHAQGLPSAHKTGRRP